MYLAILTLEASLDESVLEKLCPALDGLAVGSYASRMVEGDEQSPWLMRWICEENPDISDLDARLSIWCEVQNIALYTADKDRQKDWQVEKIDESRDWLAESYQAIQPFDIGDFFIYGSHYEGNIPAGKIPLQVDAATAFGSGEHPTTAGCMRAILHLNDNGFTPKNIMDMGCGSGILAIAALKIWPHSTSVAIDIEQEAIEVTRRHQKLNHIAPEAIISATGPGFDTPLAIKSSPYDLIFANILAAPLIEMADDLLSHTASGGAVILSGLLNEQADNILEHYLRDGISLIRHEKIEEWSTLLLKKA